MNRSLECKMKSTRNENSATALQCQAAEAAHSVKHNALQYWKNIFGHKSYTSVVRQLLQRFLYTKDTKPSDAVAVSHFLNGRRAE